MSNKIINQSSNNFDEEPSRNLKISEFTESESMDLILDILLKYPNSKAGINDFKRILFPNNTKEEIKYLLVLISEHIPEIVDSKIKRSDMTLKTNPKTESFFKNGGFSKIKDINEKTNSNIINNDFRGATIEQVIQDSDFSNSQKTNYNKEQSIVESKQKSSVKKTWELISNNKLIVLLIGIFIEEVTWGKIWKPLFELFSFVSNVE